MRFDPQVFKPNDIRGTYPDQLNDAFARLLGRALAQRLGAARVALGMDSRISSPPLCGALADQAGLRGLLCTVWDLNLAVLSVTRIDDESNR